MKKLSRLGFLSLFLVIQISSGEPSYDIFPDKTQVFNESLLLDCISSNQNECNNAVSGHLFEDDSYLLSFDPDDREDFFPLEGSIAQEKNNDPLIKNAQSFDVSFLSSCRSTRLQSIESSHEPATDKKTGGLEDFEFFVKLRATLKNNDSNAVSYRPQENRAPSKSVKIKKTRKRPTVAQKREKMVSQIEDLNKRHEFLKEKVSEGTKLLKELEETVKSQKLLDDYNLLVINQFKLDVECLLPCTKSCTN